MSLIKINFSSVSSEKFENEGDVFTDTIQSIKNLFIENNHEGNIHKNIFYLISYIFNDTHKLLNDLILSDSDIQKIFFNSLNLSQTDFCDLLKCLQSIYNKFLTNLFEIDLTRLMLDFQNIFLIITYIEKIVNHYVVKILQIGFSISTNRYSTIINNIEYRFLIINFILIIINFYFHSLLRIFQIFSSLSDSYWEESNLPKILECPQNNKTDIILFYVHFFNITHSWTFFIDTFLKIIYDNFKKCYNLSTGIHQYLDLFAILHAIDVNTKIHINSFRIENYDYEYINEYIFKKYKIKIEGKTLKSLFEIDYHEYQKLLVDILDVFHEKIDDICTNKNIRRNLIMEHQEIWQFFPLNSEIYSYRIKGLEKINNCTEIIEENNSIEIDTSICDQFENNIEIEKILIDIDDHVNMLKFCLDVTNNVKYFSKIITNFNDANKINQFQIELNFSKNQLISCKRNITNFKDFLFSYGTMTKYTQKYRKIFQRMHDFYAKKVEIILFQILKIEKTIDKINNFNLSFNSNVNIIKNEFTDLTQLVYSNSLDFKFIEIYLYKTLFFSIITHTLNLIEFICIYFDILNINSDSSSFYDMISSSDGIFKNSLFDLYEIFFKLSKFIRPAIFMFQHLIFEKIIKHEENYPESTFRFKNFIIEIYSLIISHFKETSESLNENSKIIHCLIYKQFISFLRSNSRFKYSFLDSESIKNPFDDFNDMLDDILINKYKIKICVFEINKNFNEFTEIFFDIIKNQLSKIDFVNKEYSNNKAQVDEISYIDRNIRYCFKKAKYWVNFQLGDCENINGENIKNESNIESIGNILELVSNSSMHLIEIYLIYKILELYANKRYGDISLSKFSDLKKNVIALINSVNFENIVNIVKSNIDKISLENLLDISSEELDDNIENFNNIENEVPEIKGNIKTFQCLRLIYQKFNQIFNLGIFRVYSKYFESSSIHFHKLHEDILKKINMISVSILTSIHINRKNTIETSDSGYFSKSEILKENKTKSISEVFKLLQKFSNSMKNDLVIESSYGECSNKNINNSTQPLCEILDISLQYMDNTPLLKNDKNISDLLKNIKALIINETFISKISENNEPQKEISDIREIKDFLITCIKEVYIFKNKIFDPSVEYINKFDKFIIKCNAFISQLLQENIYSSTYDRELEHDTINEVYKQLLIGLNYYLNKFKRYRKELSRYHKKIEEFYSFWNTFEEYIDKYLLDISENYENAITTFEIFIHKSLNFYGRCQSIKIEIKYIFKIGSNFLGNIKVKMSLLNEKFQQLFDKIFECINENEKNRLKFIDSISQLCASIIDDTICKVGYSLKISQCYKVIKEIFKLYLSVLVNKNVVEIENINIPNKYQTIYQNILSYLRVTKIRSEKLLITRKNYLETKNFILKLKNILNTMELGLKSEFLYFICQNSGNLSFLKSSCENCIGDIQRIDDRKYPEYMSLKDRILKFDNIYTKYSKIYNNFQLHPKFIKRKFDQSFLDLESFFKSTIDTDKNIKFMKIYEVLDSDQSSNMDTSISESQSFDLSNETTFSSNIKLNSLVNKFIEALNNSLSANDKKYLCNFHKHKKILEFDFIKSLKLNINKEDIAIWDSVYHNMFEIVVNKLPESTTLDHLKLLNEELKLIKLSYTYVIKNYDNHEFIVDVNKYDKFILDLDNFLTLIELLIISCKNSSLMFQMMHEEINEIKLYCQISCYGNFENRYKNELISIQDRLHQMVDSSIIMAKNISNILPYISISLIKIVFSLLNEFYTYMINVKAYIHSYVRSRNAIKYDQNIVLKYHEYVKELDLMLEKIERENTSIDPHSIWLFFVKINMFGFEIYQDVFSTLKTSDTNNSNNFIFNTQLSLKKIVKFRIKMKKFNNLYLRILLNNPIEEQNNKTETSNLNQTTNLSLEESLDFSNNETFTNEESIKKPTEDYSINETESTNSKVKEVNSTNIKDILQNYERKLDIKVDHLYGETYIIENKFGKKKAMLRRNGNKILARIGGGWCFLSELTVPKFKRNY